MTEVRQPPGEVVEAVARESYGRLLSYLAARCGDLAAAEDALAEAFVAALDAWPRDGVPAAPEAWLLTAARHRLIDGHRRARVRADAVDTLQRAADAAADAAAEHALPDERLAMLFVCAHPAIDPDVRTPLMLQVVLGLDAVRIAAAFLERPTAIGQRLVRAKAKIRTARIPFRVPAAAELPERLDAVLEAIYAAYGSGWDDIAGVDPRRRGLAAEAIFLARILARLLPDAAEVRGLLALMLHCEARRDARRSPDARYVPLAEQDVRAWSAPLMAEAERELAAAAAMHQLGRFQLEAAIQSAHAERVHSGHVDWAVLALLYEGLVRSAPTLGALVGRAAAVGESTGPAAALELLDACEPHRVAAYQPYWAVRGHVLRQLDRPDEAALAFDRAVALTSDPAVRSFLEERKAS